MSRSWVHDADRGQVHPLPALVAVLGLTLALVAYAGVMTRFQQRPVSDQTPGQRPRR